MKNKLLSSVLISMVFPVCGNAAPVTGDELNIGTGNTVLAGSKSGAIGTYNEVSDYALAVGNSNFAETGAFVVGSSNEAGVNSLVGGSSSAMYGDSFNSHSSLVFGQGNYAGRTYASALFGLWNDINFDRGMPAVTGGEDSGALVAGSYNKILRGILQSGSGNIVLGRDNTIDPRSGGDQQMIGSVLIGLNNSSAKTESWAIGKGNLGQTGTVTLGTYGSEVSAASLIVGTGTANNARSNGLVVLKNGTVQIPSGNLVLGSESALTAGYLSANHYLTRNIGSSSSVLNGGLIAFGDGSTANGNCSASIGGGTIATGEYAMAFGAGTSATGLGATSMGAWSHATGDFAIAAGVGATASAREAYAIGSMVEAKTQGSVVLGYYSKAEGLASSVVGRGNRAVGDFSFAAGVNNRATAYGSTVLGSKNIGIGSGGWNDLNPILEVGNGYPWGDVTSNAITTFVNGRTTLTNKFWVSTTPTVVPSASQTSGGEALVVEGHTVLKGNTKLAGKVTLEEAQGDISMGIYE